MKDTSPLNRAFDKNRAPLPRYIPPPLPTKSDADRELQKLTQKYTELQDDFELQRGSNLKKEQLIQRREKELEALRKVLKEEVQSHDQEIDKLKNITQDHSSKKL